MVGACPTCGAPPGSIVETVLARILEDDEVPGRWDYEGYTELDGQAPLVDPARPGEVLLACAECAERWWSPRLEVPA